MSRTAPGCHRAHPPPVRPGGLAGGHRDGASGRGQGGDAITSALLGTLALALRLQRPKMSAVRLSHLGGTQPKGVSPKNGGMGKGASPVPCRGGSGVAQPWGQQGCALAQNDGGKRWDFWLFLGKEKVCGVEVSWRNCTAFVLSHFTGI